MAGVLCRLYGFPQEHACNSDCHTVSSIKMLIVIISIPLGILLMYVFRKKEGKWGVSEGQGVGGEVNIRKYKKI